MTERTQTIAYKASPTLAKFHASNKFYRVVRGPVGSGKSTGMCFELFRRAASQAQQSDGIRRSRFAVVRSTYRELQDTTLKTWLDWFPEDLDRSKFNRADMTHYLRVNDIDCEILFRALDRPDDIKKLLSLELTGAWFNECRESPLALVEAMSDRVGRYPSRKDGGCTWRGIIADTNPPDDDHWLYRLAETDRPDNWGFFVQPGGLIERDGQFIANPDAENIANIEPDYYITRAAGKSRDHVRVYYCNEYGFVRDGKPVYPEYVDSVHCHTAPILPNPNQPLYIGVDFGLTPAAAFGQRDVLGRITMIDELVTEDMGAVRFGELLKTKLLADYSAFISSGQTITINGDPAGDQRAQTDERTPFQILNLSLADIGLTILPAHTNDPIIRREAVAQPLSRLIDGKPGMIMSPKCAVLRKALAGGYAYKRMQVAGDERYQDKPDKGKYSHVADAHQYMCLAMGEGHALVTSPVKPYQRQPRPRAREF